MAQREFTSDLHTIAEALGLLKELALDLPANTEKMLATHKAAAEALPWLLQMNERLLAAEARVEQLLHKDEYNGHPNYPTWAVELWLDNEEGSRNYWLEQAETMNISELADAMKAELTDEGAELDFGSDEGMKADLGGWAVGMVDWEDIAENYIQAAKENMAADGRWYPKFEEYDRVRLVKPTSDTAEGTDIPAGTIGSIREIDREDEDVPYRVRFDFNDGWSEAWVAEDALELVNE